MTTAGAQFRVGDTVTIGTGEAANKKTRITMVLPTQGTVLGKESAYVYKTDASPEFYRAQDLRR